MDKKKRILIATGIYPPDIGGPAAYVRNLSAELAKQDWEINILTYADKDEAGVSDDGKIKIKKISRKQNILKRYLRYFIASWRLAKESAVIFVFDPVSVGLPAGLASRLRGRPAVLRLGGDWLWEKSVESGRTGLPLAAYYQNRGAWDLTERRRAWFLRIILKLFIFTVFTTDWQRSIYENFLGIKRENTAIIANPLFIPKSEGASSLAPSKEVIFAGRLLKLKNPERLLATWPAMGADNYKLVIYGDGPEKNRLEMIIRERKLEEKIIIKGPVRQSGLFAAIARCAFVVIPSLSEISPNLALESLALGKIVLLTRENGLDPAINELMVLFNPLDTEDLKNKISFLLNEDKRKELENKIRNASIKTKNWQEVAQEYAEYFNNLIAKYQII